jgi:hypothetical protein
MRPQHVTPLVLAPLKKPVANPTRVEIGSTLSESFWMEWMKSNLAP